MITRRIGSLLRGKATPFQIVAACVLGALLGFAPPPLLAPALYVLLVAALLVVNANLGLALLVAAGARLVALLVVPLSFQVGRFLLEGPTSGIARAIVNAPVLAWSGLERYAAAGGQLVGLVLGLVVGLALARALGAFRRRMMAASENPSRLRELAARPWARFALWLFFGGKGKETWEQKLARRVGNPVRVWGAALLVLLLVGAWLGQRVLAGPLARQGLQSALQSANGATVDVGGVALDLAEGRVAVSGLALADPEALASDLFRAAHLEADLDEADFLRGRLHMGRLVVREAQSGVVRATPGERIGPPPPPPAAEGPPVEPGDLELEDVLAEVEVWKERLRQAQRWLERISGPPEEAGEPGSESFGERIAREVRERGWWRVRAEHLVESTPRFLLSQLEVDGLEAAWLPGRVFDLRGLALSTQPWLVDEAPRLELASRDGAILFEVDLGPASRGGGPGALRVRWNGLSVDETFAKLKLPGAAPVQGGTLDLALEGTWADGRIGVLDLPLRATLRDTMVVLQGLEPTPVEELVLPVALSGPLGDLRVRFEGESFAQALAAAGKERLAREVRSRLEGGMGLLREELGIDGLPLPEDLSAGALQEAAEQAAREAARKAAEKAEQEAKEEVEERAKGLLEGVLGGKKKKDG